MSQFRTNEEKNKLLKGLNAILSQSVDERNSDRAPGVVFGVTNDSETVYLESAGYSDVTSKDPLKKDTTFQLYSCTKAVVILGVLQLWERNLLDLDAPVKQYVPEIEKCCIIKKHDENGAIETKKPSTDVTMRMLLTHTAGFAYSFFNEEYCKARARTGKPDIFQMSPDIMEHTFLVFNPGEKWHYGMNIDWAGVVVERITGKRLGEFLKESVFEPAQLDLFTFSIPDRSNLTKLHFRDENGNLSLNKFQQDINPPVDLGGSGIFGTIDDYLKYIRIWLNEGSTPEGVQLIKPETARYALQNHLADGIDVTSLYPIESDITRMVLENNPREKWSLPFAITTSDLPTGRPKGSHYWCGIANLFYWIDTKNKIGGMWATQVLPFLDPSLKYYAELEKKTYECIQ